LPSCGASVPRGRRPERAGILMIPKGERGSIVTDVEPADPAVVIDP
jgi:hypothetical protein